MSKKMEPKSLKIKEDDESFSRLMSKDLALSSSSLSNTSSHHYYYVGASGAIPFMWESQPGTPKHVLFSDNSSLIPPLTPPPSHNSKSSMQMMNNIKKTSKRSGLTSFIFLSWKTIIKSSTSSSPHVSPSSTLSNNASSSSSTNCSPFSSRSSSWSSSSTKSKNHHHHCRPCRRYRCFSSRSGDHVHDYNDDEEEEDGVHDSASGLSPNSTLCFGVISKRKKIVMNGRCGFGNVKGALLSIAGRRSGIGERAVE